MKEQLFYEELARIQQRHGIFFPSEAFDFIQVSYVDGNPTLVFLEGHDLSEVITMELKLAFKMAMSE